MGGISNPVQIAGNILIPQVAVDSFAWGLITGTPGTQGLGFVGLNSGGNPVGSGTQIDPSMTASSLGTLRRGENVAVGSGASGGWSTNNTGQLDRAMLQVSSVAGRGGWYCEIYGGIGENYASGNNPGFFIGLNSYSASPQGPPVWTGGNQNDYMGLGVQGGASGSAQAWGTVTQIGNAAASFNVLAPSLVAAAQQLFAVSFVNNPGSIVIVMNAKLWNGSSWVSLVSNFSFNSRTGIGLTPGIQVQNAAGAGNNGVFWHRCYWQADITQVPKAF
jgi:hypothetical protein